MITGSGRSILPEYVTPGLDRSAPPVAGTREPNTRSRARVRGTHPPHTRWAPYNYFIRSSYAERRAPIGKGGRGTGSSVIQLLARRSHEKRRARVTLITY